MLSGVFCSGVRRTRALLLATVVALLGGIVLAACSHDGRTLAPVDPDYTTTSGATISSGAAGPVGSQAGSESGGAGGGGDAPAFLLSSDGFVPGGELTAAYTCAGAGVSPPLSWTPPPSGAELAIVMREHDDAGTVQWIVTGIDPVVLGFGEGQVPEGATQQVNATGTTGYLAPCPAAGSGTHTYDIVVHVLDAPLSVDPAEAAPDLAARIETTSSYEAPMSVTVTT
jgi:phosphatidylethanolamine-binding protein (PEBP) family uncharacterized protein